MDTDKDIARLERQIDKLAQAFDTFQADVIYKLSEVQTLVQHKRDMCPFREDIARAQNNNVHISDLESRVRALEKSAATTGMLGGGAVGVVVTVVYGVGKLAGWW